MQTTCTFPPESGLTPLSAQYASTPLVSLQRNVPGAPPSPALSSPAVFTPLKDCAACGELSPSPEHPPSASAAAATNIAITRIVFLSFCLGPKREHALHETG